MQANGQYGVTDVPQYHVVGRVPPHMYSLSHEMSLLPPSSSSSTAGGGGGDAAPQQLGHGSSHQPSHPSFHHYQPQQLFQTHHHPHHPQQQFPAAHHHHHHAAPYMPKLEESQAAATAARAAPAVQIDVESVSHHLQQLQSHQLQHAQSGGHQQQQEQHQHLQHQQQQQEQHQQHQHQHHQHHHQQQQQHMQQQNMVHQLGLESSGANSSGTDDSSFPDNPDAAIASSSKAAQLQQQQQQPAAAAATMNAAANNNYSKEAMVAAGAEAGGAAAASMDESMEDGNKSDQRDGGASMAGSAGEAEGGAGDQKVTMMMMSGGGGNRWPRQETLALLKIRSDMDSTFRDSSLKGPLWEVVSRKLADMGYYRSAKKCKEKFENVHKYYKRTREGRIGRQDGKNYRFFSQLEALYAGKSASPGPTTSVLNNTATTSNNSNRAVNMHALIMSANTTRPAVSLPNPNLLLSSSPIATAAASNGPPGSIIHMASATAAPAVAAAPAVPAGTPAVNSTGTAPPAIAPLPAPSKLPAPISKPESDLSSGFHFSSDETSDDDDVDDDDEDDPNDNDADDNSSSHEANVGDSGRPAAVPGAAPAGSSRKRKRKSSRIKKYMHLFESIIKKVLDKQEQMQQKLLEALERRDQDRMIREEAWKRQEMARMSREHDLRAQEHSLSASRDAVLIAFLQQVSGHTLTLPQVALPQTAPLTTPLPAPAPTPPPPAPGPAPISVIPPSAAPTITSAAAASSIVPVILDHVQDDPHQDKDPFYDPNSKRWPKAEVLALIKLRTGLEHKFHEPGSKAVLWEDISAGMSVQGYSRTAKRCKEKWENINKYFKKAKESKKLRPENAKTCPYFHQLDALYKGGVLGSSQSKPAQLLLGHKEESHEQQPLMLQQQEQQANVSNTGEDSGQTQEGDSDQILAVPQPTVAGENAEVEGVKYSGNEIAVHLFMGTDNNKGGSMTQELPNATSGQDRPQSRSLNLDSGGGINVTDPPLSSSADPPLTLDREDSFKSLNAGSNNTNNNNIRPATISGQVQKKETQFAGM